jgi:methylamine dehydrogenase heavy chain
MKKYVLLSIFVAAAALAEIQPEPLGRVRTLPDPYPPHWIIAGDAAFFHMNDGKFIIVDADSNDPASRYKGMISGTSIPYMFMAKTRPEIYVIETFLSRGHRGERTDVLTIYDKTTLAVIDEVVVPAKRISALPTEYYLQLVDDEKLALLYNFTPATSVSVIDLHTRKFLAEIPIPGCSLVYPMSGRAFSSLCSDGRLLTVQLDENGEQLSANRTDVFFDAENDPLMEKPAIIDGIAYFPTFLGNVFPIDLTGSAPAIGQSWSLVDATDGDWRPGGIVLAQSDAAGRLYVLMHPGGHDGTHKDPGTEVWVFDPETKQCVDRIELALPAITIGVTHDEDPLLITTNINLEVDVYSATSGEYQRTIGDFGQETVFIFHSDRQ